MGVEVVGFEAAPAPVEAGTEAESALLHDKENGKLDQGPGVTEPIKFGSHGDEPVKGEGNNVSDNFPKDVVDEWPAPKQIHSFYFVKYRSYDDPKIKAKLDQADKEIQKRNQARFQITEGLRAKKVNQRFLVLIACAKYDEAASITAISEEGNKFYSNILVIRNFTWYVKNRFISFFCKCYLSLANISNKF